MLLASNEAVLASFWEDLINNLVHARDFMSVMIIKMDDIWSQELKAVEFKKDAKDIAETAIIEKKR